MYPQSCKSVHDLINHHYPNINRKLLLTEDQKFKSYLYDYLSVSTVLILVITNGTLTNANCIKALEVATMKNKKVILLHDPTSKFPSYSEIKQLPKEVQYVFSTIAIPLATQHVAAVWNRISDKIFERIPVLNMICTYSLIFSRQNQ